ncbi:hypothetical protein P280DRAFT_473266 [Massarina eburnea CBS 473.64]|uniref:Uncharacterized protein n=1 Tax=Massarina eburnea CBS 473.64 TaxID=1395130 RepID=A0A6A6RKM4_9PLEO|nr:hypothetical protein P280DRAFT_473266 [Massarina eburnea CBS 473.64]
MGGFETSRPRWQLGCAWVITANAEFTRAKAARPASDLPCTPTASSTVWTRLPVRESRCHDAEVLCLFRRRRGVLAESSEATQ